MDRQRYDGDSPAYWLDQIRQRGSGSIYYTGTRLQRGAGFGSVFSSLFRTIAPLARAGLRAVKPIAKSAMKNLAKTGMDVLGETMVDGGNPAEVLKRGLKKTGRHAVKETRQKLKNQKGKGLGGIKRGSNKKSVIGAISKTSKARTRSARKFII